MGFSDKTVYCWVRDVSLLAKAEKGVPYLYIPGVGWEEDGGILEYLLLGKYEPVTGAEANALIWFLERGLTPF